MRKLRRNWSLKKSDISKSWSRIRKYSSPNLITPPSRPSITISHSNTLKRKPSRRSTTASQLTTSSSGGQFPVTDPKSVVRHHGGPVVGDGSADDTTFYITLTIEQDDDDDEDPLERIDNINASTGGRFKSKIGVCILKITLVTRKHKSNILSEIYLHRAL